MDFEEYMCLKENDYLVEYGYPISFVASPFPYSFIKPDPEKDLIALLEQKGE